MKDALLLIASYLAVFGLGHIFGFAKGCGKGYIAGRRDGTINHFAQAEELERIGKLN